MDFVMHTHRMDTQISAATFWETTVALPDNVAEKTGIEKSQRKDATSIPIRFLKILVKTE